MIVSPRLRQGFMFKARRLEQTPGIAGGYVDYR
jgi:hypothetical protein